MLYIAVLHHTCHDDIMYESNELPNLII